MRARNLDTVDKFQGSEREVVVINTVVDGANSLGRHCYSTLPLTVIDCHSLLIYTVILRSLWSFSAAMTVSHLANMDRPGRSRGLSVLRSKSALYGAFV